MQSSFASKMHEKRVAVRKNKFIFSPTCSAPLCAAYVINLGSSAQAGALRSQTITRMSSRSQIQFAAARVRTSGKDVGTEGNVIMQGHAGAMFSITAVLILIKRHPPQRITTSKIYKRAEEAPALRCFPLTRGKKKKKKRKRSCQRH